MRTFLRILNIVVWMILIIGIVAYFILEVVLILLGSYTVAIAFWQFSEFVGGAWIILTCYAQITDQLNFNWVNKRSA